MELKKSGELTHEPKPLTDVLQISQIALDSYDDIFSDFDPSPYDKRTISEDLIREMKRRYYETPHGNFIVHFTLPKHLRSEKIEALTKHRIKEHFRERNKTMHGEIFEVRKNGYVRLLIGLVLGALNVISEGLKNPTILNSFLVLSWYLMWSGFEKIFETHGRYRNDLIFLEKFAKAEYVFMDQEEIIRSIASARTSYF